ncbi:GFA family protein [Aurantiacibacter xanthus]|uniref:GFA family protein n=1 Tax=Aurantiacibacter xanthus TaxID=1784712 RepID=A0A3A1P5W5_9SPHN|nr:GFA family protein [Aurantiacibacter xanthus]RIV82942.1 GFA family protein [Aurantiacibacter xanthus]
MSEAENFAGSCLCGAVKFTAQIAQREMAVCHCSMCRKWSGGMFFAAEAERITFEDEAQLGVYSSSDWGERCFCKTCGTTLMWRGKDGSHTALAVPTLDRAPEFALTTQIFIDEKPEAYDLAQTTNNLTGAEVFAMFAPPN